MNYEDMTNEEIKKQLEWSDTHEFSYGYSMWAFDEIERLNNIIDELENDIKAQIEITKEIENLEEQTAFEYCLVRLKELKGSDKE